MWRPFAGNFANHSFDNFAQKYIRADTAPLPISHPQKSKIDINELYPYKHKKEELEERYKKFQDLQEKVKEQRKMIKERDLFTKARKEAKIRNQHSLIIQEREKKKYEMDKIRSLLNKTKPFKKTKPYSERRERKSASRAEDTTIFSLTAADNPIVLSERKPNKSPLPPIKLKPIMPVREFQDKLLKSMRGKAPTFFKDLKQEFKAIREQSEMTFEEYKEKRKIRRSDPLYSVRRRSSEM
ncbi:unnamed protein product [Blepharisma stoltei]|uniref:Uncharacterized protein n=1 Tax=Blepharisma stoltei TaxID=1481888 RepID=A0AAU9JNM1_9CILI|nr:unnamed protein product [Blepharisma stoltei]